VEGVLGAAAAVAVVVEEDIILCLFVCKAIGSRVDGDLVGRPAKK